MVILNTEKGNKKTLMLTKEEDSKKVKITTSIKTGADVGDKTNNTIPINACPSIQFMADLIPKMFTGIKTINCNGPLNGVQIYSSELEALMDFSSSLYDFKLSVPNKDFCTNRDSEARVEIENGHVTKLYFNNYPFINNIPITSKIQALTELKSLYICSFANTLPTQLFHLKKLEQLVLENDPLIILDKQRTPLDYLTLLSSLKRLSVINCNLTAMPEITNLPNLEYLNVSSNSQLKNIPNVVLSGKLNQVVITKTKVPTDYYVIRALTNKGVNITY